MERSKSNEEMVQLAQQIIGGIHQWNTQHPDASFLEIEQEVYQRMAKLHGAIIEDVVQLKSAVSDFRTLPSEEQPVCLECKGKVQSRGKRKRKVQINGGVDVTLERNYAYCVKCKTGFFPSR